MTTNNTGSKRLAWACGCAMALTLGMAQAAPPPAPKAPAAKAPAPATTTAASSAGIGTGDTEIGVFGNFTSFDDTDITLMILGGSYGQFLSDSLEMRISPALVLIDGGDAFSSVGISTVVSGEYLFRSGGNPLVPFIGAGIGLDVTSVDASGFTSTNVTLNLGPTFGAKYFLSERYSLELAMSYLIGIGTSCGTDTCEDLESDTLQTTFRFNFYY